MSVRDIPTLINNLRDAGELVEIDAPVDPNLEMAEVHRRVIAADGPALLFTNPKGYDIPVVTNLFGSRKRVDMAFGGRPKEFVETAVGMIHDFIPPTVGKAWQKRSFFRQATHLGLRNVRGGPVTEVVDRNPDMTAIPMLKSWPQDGGSFVTLPLVYTEHPDNGSHNLGMYRIHRHGPQTTGMHWQIGKGGGFHHQIAQEQGRDLPVTLLVGGPPALIVSAIAPLPENVPELLLASLLAGKRLKMARSPTDHPHRIVADAEFAFLGKVRPHDVQPEGPFGDHYGYYSWQHDYPVFHVDTICRRKNAVWPATVVGKPRQEDLYIGDYLQDLLSPLFPVVMPNVVDLWTYGETGYHALAGAVVKQRYRREAMSAALRILGEGQLSLTKFLWIADKPIDLQNPVETLEHLLARFQPETDLYIISNMSMDTLDYAGPEVNLGSKGVMLGVGDPIRELPREFRQELPGGVTDAAVFCGGCLCVSGPSHKEDPDFAQHVAKSFPDWPLVCLVDDATRAASTPTRFLWNVFTRFEPAADITAQSVRVQRNHLVYGGTIVIDSRMKGTYPDELFCDDDTAKTVNERWSEYFPQGDVEMGDSDEGHLDQL